MTRYQFQFWLFVALLLLHCLSLSSSIRWPLLPSKKTKKSPSPPRNNNSNNNNNHGLSSLPLEPLLQIPCTLQLVPSLNDEADIPKKLALTAFVDTGAQKTCMSWRAAQRAGLAHLIDQRYAGQATGVGLCRVLGRIPAHTVRFQFEGKTWMAPAITILESTGTEEVELLIGLDVLRELYAVINLEEECLQLKLKKGTIQIPFIRPRQSPGDNKKESSSSTDAEEGFKNPLEPVFEEENEDESDSDFDDNSDGDSGDLDFSGL